jgi:two-component system, cell cycle sensor histidine kinase and response regulator CckA
MAYAGHRQTESGLVDINAVVDDLQRLLSISISKKCFLELKLEKNLPLIEGSTTQLRQVLMNLVINASEAIGESGGTIRVVTGSQMCGQTDLAIALVGNTLPVGNYVFLEVSDTGSGMSEETRMKIFDPFYTTKFAGRGLGMATVLGIARRHMAAIKLTSELGKGSTFRVLFPASTRAALVTGPKAAVSEEWRSSGTVLIVDDEKPVVELTSMMMKEMGFKVISARDGRDGVDRFRDHSNEIDLVLMDMTMPRLDGEQAFREMQTIRTGVPAVLLSGFSTKITMNGFSAFLQKPFSFGELVSTVRKVMEKETNPG